MTNASQIKEHSEIIGNDGQHIGTVDRVEGSRIKLTKADSQGFAHAGHHHFIDIALVETVQDNRVHLSVASKDALDQQQEEGGTPAH